MSINSEQKKITLLEDILEELRTNNEKINELIKLNKDMEDYTCDHCGEDEKGEPYKTINKYTFCSFDCADKEEKYDIMTNKKKTAPIEQEIYNIKHLLEVVLKNQEQIKIHLWKNGEPPSQEDQIQLQEQQAEMYVKNILKPKYEQKSEGEMMAEGFFDGVVLNWIKEQAIIVIGTALKKIFLEVSVDLAKWLIGETENIIVRLYGKASEEEKETFKNKIKEVFPESPLLEKLN